MSLEDEVGADEGISQTPGGSRFNAVKHGLTAKTAVLPGESGEGLRAQIAEFKANLETRNTTEDRLAERAAVACWKLDRAERAETARLTRNIHTGPADAAVRAKKEALALGQRLFHDRLGPGEMYGCKTLIPRERTSWAGTPVDPDDPEMLILDLEHTLEGCRWLLRSWGELRAVIEAGMGWQPVEKLRAIRLMGRQPLHALCVREVAVVFLASHVIGQRRGDAFEDLRGELDEDRFERYRAQLSKRRLEEITPADADAARAVLLQIVDKATARLRVLESKHQETALYLEGLQTDILSFDESKSGEQVRRLQDNCHRLMLRSIAAIHTVRKKEAQGWGKTRQEREKKKEEAKGKRPYDPRMIIDEAREGSACGGVHGGPGRRPGVVRVGIREAARSGRFGLRNGNGR